MLSGDNGILQKATDAKTNTDSSQIQERINLAYHSSLVDGQGKVTEPSLENEIKKEFNKDTLGEGWLDKTSVAGKWKITIDGISLEVPAGIEADDNKVTIKVGTTNLKEVQNLSTLYGETTDYASVDGVEWQLFYDDTTNIYLIAKDYVPNSTLPSELIQGDWRDVVYCAHFGEYDSGRYTGAIMEEGEWIKGTESSTIINNLQTNTYLKWVQSSLASTKNNANMKAVAFMMDTNKWSDFAGGVVGAYAIGGPTLEMFVLSYNAKHNTKLETYETVDSTNADSYGYKVSVKSGDWGYYVTDLDESPTDMWFVSDTDKACSYWLSSPAASASDVVTAINYDGRIYLCLVNTACNVAFRPLVAIPKSSLK